jgi:type IV secretory pathway VirB2 component (pilin)
MNTQRALPAAGSPHAGRRAFRRIATGVLFLAASTTTLLAQSPWENAVNVLQISFTGPIARGLSLVAIVVGGLLFAFGEGQGKPSMAGIVFGVGMAIGAVNFMAWLFP